MPIRKEKEEYFIKTPVQFENGEFLVIHCTIRKDCYYSRMSDDGQIGRYVKDKYGLDISSLIHQKDFAKTYRSSGVKLEENDICRETDWREDVVIEFHDFEEFAEDLINYCDSSPKVLGDKDIYDKAEEFLDYLEKTYQKYVIDYAVAIDEDENGKLFFTVFLYDYSDTTPEYPDNFEGMHVEYVSGKKQR